MLEHLTLKSKNLRNELINTKNGRTFPTVIFPKTCCTLVFKDANSEING